MKRLMICLVTLLSCLCVVAQDYVYEPLVREGVEWGFYNYHSMADRYFDPYRIQFKGDAVIDGKVYKKAYVYTSCTLDEATADLAGWIREEDKKVYFIINPNHNYSDYCDFVVNDLINVGEEYVIYDFATDNVGDISPVWNTTQKVQEISMIDFKGKKRKQFVYESNSDELNGASFFFPIVSGLGYISAGAGNVLFPGFTMPANGGQRSVLNYVKEVDGYYLYALPDLNPQNVDPCLASVQGVSRDSLKVLQNADAITVEMPTGNAVSSIQLVDATGKVVYNAINEAKEVITIATSRFVPGAYVVIVASENTKSTCKIVIK